MVTWLTARHVRLLRRQHGQVIAKLSLVPKLSADALTARAGSQHDHRFSQVQQCKNSDDVCPALCIAVKSDVFCPRCNPELTIAQRLDGLILTYHL